MTNLNIFLLVGFCGTAISAWYFISAFLWPRELLNGNPMLVLLLFSLLIVTIGVTGEAK